MKKRFRDSRIVAKLRQANTLIGYYRTASLIRALNNEIIKKKIPALSLAWRTLEKLPESCMRCEMNKFTRLDSDLSV